MPLDCRGSLCPSGLCLTMQEMQHESPKELSKIEPSRKIQAVQPHCYNDSVTQMHFRFCFTESNETFTGNAITIGQKSCRDHPEVSVFWVQKTVSCRLQRQRKPEASAPPKTTWLLETKFPSPRSTLCFKFQGNAEHTLPQFVLHPPEN